MQEVFENELPLQWKLVTCLNESVIVELSRENNPKGRFFFSLGGRNSPGLQLKINSGKIRVNCFIVKTHSFANLGIKNTSVKLRVTHAPI